MTLEAGPGRVDRVHALLRAPVVERRVDQGCGSLRKRAALALSSGSLRIRARWTQATSSNQREGPGMRVDHEH